MSHVEIAQRSTRGSFSLFAGNFISTVVSFVAIIFIARLLGPSDYGVYALCVLVPNILLNFLGFGVNSGITRYAAYNLSLGKEDVAKRMTLNGAAFVLLMGVALTLVDVASAGFVATSIFHRPEIAPLLRFSSSFVLAQAVFQAASSCLLGWSLMGRIAWATIVQSLLRLLIAVPLLYLGFEVYGALFGYFVSVILGGAIAFIMLWKGMRATGARPGQFLGDLRTLLSYGRELFVGNLVTNFAAQYVVTILAIAASNAYVGYYQAASNFTTAVTLTSGAVSQALFPAFAHLQGAGSDVPRAFRYAVKYTGFAICPIIFLLMGASYQIIRLPLGPSYTEAAFFLALLAFSNISMLLGLGVLPSFFNGLGRPRYYMAFSLAGGAVIFPLAPLLSIVLGLSVVGLISSIFISNVVAVAVGLYIASSQMDSHVDYKACISILASSLVAYAAVVAVSKLQARDAVLLPMEVVVFLLVYLTAAPLLRAVGVEDLQILGSAFSGLGRFQVVVRPVIRYEEFVLRIARRGSPAKS